MKDDLIKFTLRMPSTLDRNLRKSAVTNRNSLNEEIVERLEQSILLSSKRISSSDPKASIKEIITEMQRLSNQLNELLKDSSLKHEFLTMEEREILSWFNEATAEEKASLLNSLPEIISLIKKVQ